MAVRMSDGWCGKVESSAGEIVSCLGDGARPDDHWAGDYRLVSHTFTIKGSTPTVAWKPVATAARATIDRKQHDAVVVDLARAKLKRSWESIPD